MFYSRLSENFLFIASYLNMNGNAKNDQFLVTKIEKKSDK